MKLNAYILYQRLSQVYPVTMYGSPQKALRLNAPQIYIDNTSHFEADHVYLATVEHLPSRPTIASNVVLVCIGENSRLAYYKEHATVLLIQKKYDFFRVFQTLQDIFNLFQTWQGQLLNIIIGTPTLEKILQCSYSIFEKPLFLLDRSFQYIASAMDPEHRIPEQNLTALASQDFLSFLKEQEMSMDRKGAFVLKFTQGNFLCFNLFNSRDEYIGCFYSVQQEQPPLPGEEQLIEYLAGILVRVMEMAPGVSGNEHSCIREILRSLLQELPLGQNQKLMLKTLNHKKRFVSISIHYQKHFAVLPMQYICSIFETLLPDSVFFEQNGTITGLVPSVLFAENTPERDAFLSYISSMQLCAGVSNDFDDLYLVRSYYYQAEAAIENGQLHTPGQILYRFSDYALMELIGNAVGSFPVEAYFPEGFRKLLEHDQAGGISYLETLSVFLDENMSYAQAAQKLYIHRSTLIERINRIQQELQMDLDDPNQRLQLQIILKVIGIEKQLKTQ